jgi:hypothetical protein
VDQVLRGARSAGAGTRQEAEPAVRDTRHMVDDIARERAIYQALKTAERSLRPCRHTSSKSTRLIRNAPLQSTFTNSLKLLRQARERLGQGPRAVEAGTIAESDEVSLRNQ